MTIIKNTVIREKWHKGFSRSPEDITEIVIHATAGLGQIEWQETSDLKVIQKRIDDALTADDKKKWTNEYNRVAQWSRGIGIPQYNIDRKGNVTEIIDPVNWVYHSCSGDHDKHSIGIEFDKVNGSNQDDITPDQMQGGVELCKQLCIMFPNIDKIVSHRYNWVTYFNNNPKPCPGPFPFESLQIIFTQFAPELGREIKVIGGI
jgi:hypothetical protein